MAANYSTLAKINRMAVIQSLLDAQTNPAQLVIFSSGYAAILATITLGKPSFTNIVGVLTLNGVPLSCIAANNGTAALAQLQDGNSTWVVEGLTCGTSGSGCDLILNSTTVVAGQVTSVTGLVITAAP